MPEYYNPGIMQGSARILIQANFQSCYVSPIGEQVGLFISLLYSSFQPSTFGSIPLSVSQSSGVFDKFSYGGSGMYHKYEADINYMTDESNYQKIF